jgi:hypothetical protein
MAAGLGFKTFTTGEVLTADNVNGYLMQGVLVFASATARDAAITSPQEGQCCYLKDTDAVQTYSGSAWVGFDDSNAIQNSIVDAKGDIVAASGNDTPARLAVGNNGETLVADSSTSTGLRYQVPVNVNPILNSAFQVWQRGTSFTGGTATTYCADRWVAYRNGVAGSTFSRQVTNDTTNLPFIQYAMRVARDSGNTSTANIQLIQSLETINSIPYAGKTVTLSFYARAGANFSAASSNLNILLQTGTGTDQSTATGFTGALNPINATQAITTTWTRYTMTAVTLSSTATQIGMQFYYTPVGTAGVNDYFEITGIQLEVGSVATPFKTYAGTIQGELAACQRYYYRATTDVVYGTFPILGFANATTTIITHLKLPVTMRVKPSSIEYPTISTIRAYDGVTTTAMTSVALSSNSSQDVAYVDWTVASGLTQYRPYLVAANNSASAYVGVSAEL